MMHGQGLRLGSRLGDALSLLVAPGGIWQAERVLFVVSGDLASGLPAAEAKRCDQKSVEVTTERGVAQVATYFEALSKGQRPEGCPGRKALPEAYSAMLT